MMRFFLAALGLLAIGMIIHGGFRVMVFAVPGAAGQQTIFDVVLQDAAGFEVWAGALLLAVCIGFDALIDAAEKAAKAVQKPE